MGLVVLVTLLVVVQFQRLVLQAVLHKARLEQVVGLHLVVLMAAQPVSLAAAGRQFNQRFLQVGVQDHMVAAAVDQQPQLELQLPALVVTVLF